MTKNFQSVYFKSKVIFVDDNDSFLEHLSYKLGDDYSIDTFNNPYQALEYILSSDNNSIVPKASDLIVGIDNEDADDELYSIDFSKMNSLINAHDKSELISVVIVDYSMPLMNGIDFCKKIADLPVLKVMLTGHADFKLAVDAFNTKIIDKFLVKDNDSMLDDIKHAIDCMQNHYFERLSYPLLHCFSSKKTNWLSSQEYINQLQTIVNELHAVEYYLLDQTGTYLLIKENGSKYYFTSISDAQLEEYIDIAQNHGCAIEIMNQMVNKTHAPFFVDEQDYQLAPSQWCSLMQPIHRKENYYFSVFSA